ncbi:signal recognition particle-docking protein FtsY [Sandarakinorhabdus cyanobacteriorum]|uniref:Signal recognition particle receptor FtsY n=1 Tax=Sandarakinorhabdus cyanobacteriorum TaxID=1981098 RepID=A0A255YHP9_9SPHN|nr:signal recognition particle-docking protein FtsY [Sandarakinorhabdus cyanobacteriorum]OYQ28204.1 signal recognition particle-docking protein FtsY [Sandarakinorhabdus cyanobacteriorum]
MSWFGRLTEGLSKSTKKLANNITGLATGTLPLDEERLDAIEEGLIAADLGPRVAARIRERLADQKYAKGIDDDGVRAVVADEVAQILAPVARPLAIIRKPQVILVVGVNGSGKTTTIAKLARLFKADGKQVMLAAGDTFRAAAIAQLKIWADRVGVPIVAGDQGGDAASLAFDAVKRAMDEGIDVLIIDTAGRLQNKTGLMDELAKVKRVIGKLDPAAPHDVLLVLDATTGQNALNQIEVFGQVAGVTGLVMTKLDGSARGGMLVAAAEKFGLPIHAIGVGEGMDDLQPFTPQDFAAALVGTA